MKREKSTWPRMNLSGTPRRTQRNDFCGFDKARKQAYEKEKIESNKYSKREVSQNEFMEKGGVPDRVESFGEINSRKDRPKTRPGFVKSIQNGLSKEQNLIESRPSKEETGLAGKENGIRFQ